MQKRVVWSVCAALILILAVVAFLLATGERGLSSGRSDRPPTPFAPRSVEVTRLGDAETEALGWSTEGLDRLFDFVSRLSTDTFIIQTAGVEVGVLGRPEIRFNVHSARKAMLSAVVGQHIGQLPNQIPIDATLEDLDIDDAPMRLTRLQRSATVLDLLRSMSGINHPAAAEGGLAADRDRRLGDSENQPGTIWAYNNWDYNALTTIFERRTGMTVAEAFDIGIARAIGMQDFSVGDAYYIVEPEVSRHRAAMFRMSGRDLARFGQLYLDHGVANRREVVPASWIDRITQDYAVTGIEGLRAGHGYLWWLPASETGLPGGSFFAWGLGWQTVMVLPHWDTVIVLQSDTEEFLRRWLAMQSNGVNGDMALERIVEQCFQSDFISTEFCREDRFTTRREIGALISLIVQARL